MASGRHVDGPLIYTRLTAGHCNTNNTIERLCGSLLAGGTTYDSGIAGNDGSDGYAGCRSRESQNKICHTIHSILCFSRLLIGLSVR